MGDKRKVYGTFVLFVFLMSVPLWCSAEQTDEPSKVTNQAKVDEELSVSEEKEMTKTTTVDGQVSESPDSEKQEEVAQLQSPGLINVGLLESATLDANHTTLPDGTERITLTYEGHGTLNLNLLSNTYAIFHLPSEIRNVITKGNLSATYDVPALGALGIEIRNKGSFSPDDITLKGNQVYMNFFNLLSINLLNFSYYTFTLTIDLEKLPLTRTGKYVFYSGVTKQVVELSLLSDDTVARSELSAPQLRDIDAPIMNPVYSNENAITGSGEPNTNVHLTINEEKYVGPVDENGNFSVTIPEQEPGTVISAILKDDVGNVSEATEVTVIEAKIAFYHVPESLSFTPTTISPGVIRIPRQIPDWTLEVMDTRGAGSEFRVMAEADEPLKNVNGHTLSDALVFVDENSNSLPLTSGPIEVYAGTTGDNQITRISWSEDVGPFIEVDAGNVYEGTYSTTITWTLVDAP